MSERSSITSRSSWAHARGRNDRPEYHDACAADLERLAALLGAGLTPAVAWASVVTRAPVPHSDASNGGTARRSGFAAVFRTRGAESSGMAGLRRGHPSALRAVQRALDMGQDPASALLAVGNRGHPARGRERERGSGGGGGDSGGERTGSTGHRGRKLRRAARPDSGVDTSLPWAHLAATWSVSAQTGAPLAEGVRELAAALRARARLGRACAAEAAGPRSSARLVCWLPVISTLFGEALGFSLLDTLTGTAPGQVLLGFGVGLSAITAVWIGSLIRRALRVPPEPDVIFELTATGLAAGLSPVSARECAERALTRCGLPVPADALRSLHETLSLAGRVGIAAHALLRAEAQSLRDRRSSDLLRGVNRLGTRLLIPLGAGALPAFFCLGVAPMMLTLLHDSLGTVIT